METENTNPQVNHGRNIKAARKWKNLSQEDLADLMKKTQPYIHKLEYTKTIDKKVLEHVAECLNVDLNFLETFVPEDVMKSFNMNDFDKDNTLNDNAVENSGNNIDNQQIIDNSLPFDKVQVFIDEIRNQDKIIADLRVKLAKNGIDDVISSEKTVILSRPFC